MEAGMFLKGIDAHLLIDTGATLTLVSTALAETIVDTIMPMLDPVPEKVYDAGGKTLNVSGKGKFTLKVGSFSCTVNAAVADLTMD
jgi:predicted aspartyl protease